MKINSKHRSVARAPYMLYMPFSDMRNFVAMLPEDKRQGVEADYDSIRGTVQGFSVGVRVEERRPYSRIVYKDDGAPFQFTINICFDADGGNPDSTDFHIDIEADLNFMMKMLLGNKFQDAVDKMVDAVADMAMGKMPEGIDPSMYPKGFDPSQFKK
ncbi:MAG: hypothetical protein PUB47_04205 [Bacteroides sp.]|nr:hypothetical protein [Bacteroidales bacterium]MCI7462849.1 hypothetical protein [Bacteroides sp.]MDY2972468.1 hypothetical protein [Candidatus Cryptobacteroides sp.]HAW07206.1 hypothetical protein [Rikenellaceae bacterium]MDD6149851.1 hypothetical protein [Bacteroides sp.]